MTLLTPELLDTKTYGFEKLRYLLQSIGIQEGVVDAADLKVVQRALGANMSVDVGTGRCFIQADSGTRNGLYHEVNDAMVNVAVTASNATNPRIDQVVLEVHDSSDLGSADDTPQLYVVAGAPTAGATLDNRNGAAALPANAIRLADILVPAASSSVVTANIRDRRQWARGAYRRIVRNANAAAGSHYTTTTVATLGDVDATNLKPRLEVAGNPVHSKIMGATTHSVANGLANLALAVDGALLDGAVNVHFEGNEANAAANTVRRNYEYGGVPSAGSHLFGPMFSTQTAGTFTLLASATHPLVFVVQEQVTQNADNS